MKHPSEAQTVVPNGPENSPETQERVAVSWFVDDKGAIQWDRMRPKMKDAIRDFVTNAEVQREFGASPNTPASVEMFDPKWTGTLYDVVGKVESFFAAKMYKISPEICEQAFTYSSAEKEKLAEPTAKVINKYAPIWLVQFKDEIALAFLFVTITAVKLQMAVTLQQLKTQAEKAKTQMPAPQPIRPEPAKVETVAPGASPTIAQVSEQEKEASA